MNKPKRTPRATAATVKLAELSLAVPQVVAHRLTRMALAGASASKRDQKEFTGMVVEKQVAFTQAWLAAVAQGVRWQQQVALSFMTGATSKQHAAQAKQASSRLVNAALTPIHRKATSNAKRLAGTKLR
jgi:proline dehydrogenase